MENQLIVGVMGGGMANPQDTESAYRLGSLIAEPVRFLRSHWHSKAAGRSS
jgi:hypothetical protein